MVCDNCGENAAVEKRSTKTYGKGADLLVVENVPIVFCHACGESYLTAATLHEIDALKKDRKNRAFGREVEVAVFR